MEANHWWLQPTPLSRPERPAWDRRWHWAPPSQASQSQTLNASTEPAGQPGWPTATFLRIVGNFTNNCISMYFFLHLHTSALTSPGEMHSSAGADTVHWQHCLLSSNIKKVWHKLQQKDFSDWYLLGRMQRRYWEPRSWVGLHLEARGLKRRGGGRRRECMRASHSTTSTHSLTAFCRHTGPLTSLVFTC